jgi:hypothetical protein
MRLNTSRASASPPQQVIVVLPFPGAWQRRAGRLVLHPRDHVLDRVEGDHMDRDAKAAKIGEDRREDPEHHQPEADHADGVVEQMAVKPQMALERDRQGKGDDERDPDRQQLRRHPAENALAPGRHQDAADDIGKDQADDGKERPQGQAFGPDGGAGHHGQGVVGVHDHLVLAREDRQHDRCKRGDDQGRNGGQHRGVQDRAEAARPGDRFHGSALPRTHGCAGSGRRSRCRRSAG